MNIQTLLNHLATGGFRLEPFGDDELKVYGAVELLTSPVRAAIREHKPTLRRLACIPLSEDEAEREAIRWADTPEAQAAIEEAMRDWDSLPDPPAPCPACGSLLFRWDILGDKHCIRCDPGKSDKVLRLVERIRNQTADMVENKSPEVVEHQGRL